jgi:hypothetical protein
MTTARSAMGLEQRKTPKSSISRWNYIFPNSSVKLKIVPQQEFKLYQVNKLSLETVLPDA